jgi:hypothetical protein
MVTTLQGNSWAKEHITQSILASGIVLGLIGGMLGMLVVDLMLMGTLSIAGLSPFTCFSTVGDTVARFFSILGIEMTGGVPLGVATHYVVGPLLGAIFAATIARGNALRAGTLKKYVVLAVLYGEVVSQPLFAMIPILLKMATSETLVWFFGSLTMHFIWGIVLGAVVSYGLRFANGASNK